MTLSGSCTYTEITIYATDLSQTTNLAVTHWRDTTAGEHVRLYYINTNNRIHQIIYDQSSGGWHPDAVITQSIQTYPGSSLAAATDSADLTTDSPAFTVYYTDASGQLGSFGWADGRSIEGD